MSEADKIMESLKKSGKKVEEFYISNKTSDNNVANIEDDVKILRKFINEAQDLNNENGWHGYYDVEIKAVSNAMQNILSEREQMLKEKQDYKQDIKDFQNALNEENLRCANYAIENNELKKRIQELEEENKKLKAQCIFTRNNNATDQEKAELYDMIDKTIDTFLEQEKPIWQQEMIKDKMSLEEALSIVDEMYQNKYKIIEKIIRFMLIN